MAVCGKQRPLHCPRTRKPTFAIHTAPFTRNLNFRIAMGGLYGDAVAMALDDCPHAARYVKKTSCSGTSVNRVAEPYFQGCLPVLIIIIRLCLPEAQSYIERDAVRKANGSIASTFIAEGKDALENNWLLLSCPVLMAGFNFTVSHHYLYSQPLRV